MTTPHQSHCELCTWSSDPLLDRDTAGCYATWHVYEEHRSMWRLIFGNEPPRDPDPRVITRPIGSTGRCCEEML